MQTDIYSAKCIYSNNSKNVHAVKRVKARETQDQRKRKTQYSIKHAEARAANLNLSKFTYL